jgi:hypothetical protein
MVTIQVSKSQHCEQIKEELNPHILTNLLSKKSKLCLSSA